MLRNTEEFSSQKSNSLLRNKIMKKSLEKLALIYFGEKDGRRFFEYIIESQINGNFKQVVNLFNEMQYADKARFLIELTKNGDCCELPFSYTDRRECFTNIVNNIFKTK